MDKLDKSYHDLRVAKHKANGFNEITPLKKSNSL